MPRKKTLAKVRLKAYSLVSDAVENGVSLGINRAHKHTDTPTREHISETISRSVMEILCEVVDWDRSG